MDIDADDDAGKEYNIEVQRADKGADRKRARYHSSILDAHLLHPGDDFSNLPETFVIMRWAIEQGQGMVALKARQESDTWSSVEALLYHHLGMEY